MRNPFTEFKTDTDKRHYVRVGAFVVMGVACVVLILHLTLTIWNIVSVSPSGDTATNGQGTATDLLPEFTTADGRPLPVALSIPSLGITAPFEAPLGLGAGNAINVPDGFDTVGWYKNGPLPGEAGPAVVLGHVDSKRGPAVFFSLGQAVPGTEVIVTNADGTESVFQVTHFERYDQQDFPTALVYGDVDHEALRLVTCSGSYDKGESRYTHNLVVYAKLIETRSGS